MSTHEAEAGEPTDGLLETGRHTVDLDFFEAFREGLGAFETRNRCRPKYALITPLMFHLLQSGALSRHERQPYPDVRDGLLYLWDVCLIADRQALHKPRFLGDFRTEMQSAGDEPIEARSRGEVRARADLGSE